MRCSAVAAGTASSARLAMLKEFHARTTEAIHCA
jgi:hypothetical protein